MRVEFFQTGPTQRDLEQAALGSYEVLACKRVQDNGGSWLDVSLREAFPTGRPRRRRS
jgi:hypothetical protein